MPKRVEVVKERKPERVAAVKKAKPEEVAMAVETKKRKPMPVLGDVTFAAVAPTEVPELRWGKGLKSPFQPVYDKMYSVFAEGQALRLELASSDIAKTVGKAAQARAKRDGRQVRSVVDGSILWLLEVKRESEARATP